METFTKIPKELFKLGLSPNEFIVMSYLIYIEDYRKFKNEIKDGWFVKSKSELSVECGLGDRHRLYRTLDRLQDKGLIEIRSSKNVPSKFKINYFQINAMVQNNTGTMVQNTPYKVQNDTTPMVQNEPLHKTKNKTEGNNTIKQDSTSTSTYKLYKEESLINQEKQIQPLAGEPIGNPSFSFEIVEFVENYYSKGGRLIPTDIFDDFVFKNVKALIELGNNKGSKLTQPEIKEIYYYVNSKNDE